MLDFSDQPYQWFPPRYSAFWAGLLTRYNRHWHLPRTKLVRKVEVSGERSMLAQRGDDTRWLLLPNHPTHADPETFHEALSQVGVTSQTMAAYDVFLRSRLNAWVMQRLGAFSVDREAADPRTMKQASATLAEGRHGLTVFPEGNVHLQNDRVTPFHEGAAMLGLRSAKALAGQGVRVMAVPVAMKATYITDVRDAVMASLRRAAGAVDVQLDESVGPVGMLRSVGEAALHRNLRQRGIDTPDADDLPQLIERSADAVLTRLESKLDGHAKPGDSLIDRIRKARRTIHQVRSDPERAADHRAAEGWADEAMLAFKIVGYSLGYVDENATLDRVAETVEKLNEDIFSVPIKPFGPRHTYVRFGEPIDLSDYLDAFKDKARVAVRSLTGDVESAVQAGLDALNAENRCEGAKPW